MAGSAAEREVRGYAVPRIREMLPGARIIHELVVAGCRADLAAVETERITLFEIKSSRDKLDRLPEQVRQFTRAAHDVVVIADERWFDQTPYATGHARFVPRDDLWISGHSYDIWAFPEVPGRAMHGTWSLTNWRKYRWRRMPHAERMLELIWREEMIVEAHRHGINAGSRSTRASLMDDLAWKLTGEQVVRAVCRQLRQRRFPEADPPC